MSSNAPDGNDSAQADNFLRALRSAASKAQIAANRFRSSTMNLEPPSVSNPAMSEVGFRGLPSVHLRNLDNGLALQAARKDPEISQYDQIIRNHHMLQSRHANTSLADKAIDGKNRAKKSKDQVERNRDWESSSFKSAVSTPIEPDDSTDVSRFTTPDISTYKSDESSGGQGSSIAVKSSGRIGGFSSSPKPGLTSSGSHSVELSNPLESQEVSERRQKSLIGSNQATVIGKRKRSGPPNLRHESQSSRSRNPFREVVFQLDTIKKRGDELVHKAVLQRKGGNVNQPALLESQVRGSVNSQSQIVPQFNSNRFAGQKIDYAIGQIHPDQKSALQAPFTGTHLVQQTASQTKPHDISLLGPGQTPSLTQKALVRDFSSESLRKCSTLSNKAIALERDTNNTGFAWSNVNTRSDSQTTTAQDFLHNDKRESHNSSSRRSALEPLNTSSSSLLRTGSQLDNRDQVHLNSHYVSPYCSKGQNEFRTVNYVRSQKEFLAEKLDHPPHTEIPIPTGFPTMPTHTRRKAHVTSSTPSLLPPPIHYVPSIRAAPTSSLLRSRELGGTIQYDGIYLNSQGITVALRKHITDKITYWRGWIGASKDVLVVTWAPDGSNFAVGASTELDDLNIQYNRRNNLLLGNLESNTLRELPDHYVDRPLPETIESGDNSHQATYDAVDPELYTTVSSICFNDRSDRMFTASYDSTVKVWDVARGKSTCVSTLQHKEAVDHLALSGECLATGQQTIKESIRIYQLDTFDDLDNLDGDQAPLATFGSTRAQKQKMFPTCLQFGKTPETTGLLLGGYSEVNVDLRTSDREGDICLWNVETGHSFKITPMAQSVWDIAWHPRLSIFAAATAPGLRAKLTFRHTTHSVVRTWSPMEGLGRIMEYECPAADINIVTFNPRDDHYVSASCTDGSTYVWDQRSPDRILHQLKHGKPIDELDNEISIEDQDTGVCMSTWDQDGRVLYTGSSDGVIKAWNIYQSAEDASIREVAKFNSGIMCGSFSPDYTNLLVGLSIGGVQILSSCPTTHPSNDDDIIADHTAPYETIRHFPAKEPEKEDSGIAAARDLLSSGRIEMHPIYGAGRGPNYDGPYAAYAHPADADPSVTELIPEFRAVQLDGAVRRAGRRAGGKPENPELKKVYRNAGKIAYARNYSWYGIKKEKQGEKRPLEGDDGGEEGAGGSGVVKRGRGSAYDPITLDDDDEADEEAVAMIRRTGNGKGKVKEEEGVEDDYEEDPLEEDYYFY